MNKVYVLVREYYEFEDVECNYAEIVGAYKTKTGAKKKLFVCVEEEKDLDMVLRINKNYSDEATMFRRMGHIVLEQDIGCGKVRLTIEEKEVK